MSSQPPWETQIQPGWGSQPQPPEQPQQAPQQPQQGGGWNQGPYAPPQQPMPQQGPPPQPMQQPMPPQSMPQSMPQPGPGQYPQFPMQPPPPQFTPPQMPGVPFPGDAPPPKKNTTGRVVAIVVAAVVLVGGAGGIYVLTKGDKSTPKAQPAPTAAASTPTTPTTPASSSASSSSSSSFPDNSYTGSAAPPASASSPAGGASLDSATTDKTPFTADALVAKSFTDDKKVTYALKFAQSQPCAKVGDAVVQNIVRSVDCTNFMAASWIDPANSRIVVSAMVIPYPDAATATAIYKKLSATHTGDYAQWCPPAGQPGAETCTKLAKGGTFTREGKFGSFHRYVLITTAVYADLRNDNSQKDWLTSAAHGAFQNTLPGQ
ncbi:hypothetical protein [Catenulispora rubra]|uniref:hypothetical protein n=1 Tax=Catenulispora rubra TaxID=280293 RepID=UPI00189264D2|nr:hypothetical protein [Catenulispora rubra]